MQLPVLPNDMHWYVDVNTNCEYDDSIDYTTMTEFLEINTVRIPPRTTVILIAE